MTTAPADESSRVGLAVIGLGRIGRFHAETAARKLEGARLVRVMDADPEAVAAVTGQPRVRGGSALEDVLGDPAVDAVVIATPTRTHARLIGLAAQAGKHVFTEKPLAMDLASSAQAIDAATRAGVHLQVGLHRRYDPDWRRAKELIDAGALGTIRMFRASLRDVALPPLDYLREAGDFFVDMTIHELDAARWLVGPVVEISAFATVAADQRLAEVDEPDNALVVLRFESGALGVIDNSRVAGYGYECSAELVGSESTLRLGYHQRASDVERLDASGVHHDHPQAFVTRSSAAYVAELQAFADGVRHGRPPVVDGCVAVAAHRLALSASASSRAGRPVRVDEPVVQAQRSPKR